MASDKDAREGPKTKKVRAPVKRVCPKCKIIRRKGKVNVICENPNNSKDKANGNQPAIGLWMGNYGRDREVRELARIAGVDLPRNKRVEIGLTYIYGIGRSRSNEILVHTDVDPDTRVKDLTDGETSRLREFIDRNFSVEGELRRKVTQNIQRLKEIGCYRGIRHRHGLPVRGQRTRTNARTRKGPRKTVPGRGRRRGARKQ